MTPRMIARIVAVAAPLWVTGLAGCPFSPSKGGTKPDPVPSNYLPQTSITNVLANLKTAYTEKNYNEYIKLLDPSFAYNFAPEDVGQNDIPATWGFADETASTENMFSGHPNQDGYRAEGITLTFEPGVPQPDPDEMPGTTLVVLSSVFLTVEGRHETTADLLYYEVEGDHADLYFKQTDEVDSGTGLKIWKIARWDDKPITGGLVAANL